MTSIRRYATAAFLFLVLSLSLRAQNPNTAVFPGGVVTDAKVGVASNKFPMTLTQALGASDTTLYVDSNTGVDVPAIVWVESEAIWVCSKPNSTSFVVCSGGRGADRTTPATHSLPSRVNNYMSANQINQLSAEVQQIEAAYTNVVKWADTAAAATINKVVVRDGSGKIAAVGADFTGDVSVVEKSTIYKTNDSWGSWARDFVKLTTGTGADLGAFGGNGSNGTTLNYFYVGYGSTPYDQANGMIARFVPSDKSFRVIGPVYAASFQGNATTASGLAGTPDPCTGSNWLKAFTSAGVTTCSQLTWSDIGSRPTALSQFTNDSGFQTSSGMVANATNASQLGSLSLCASAAICNSANSVPRLDSNGYLNLAWLSTTSGDNGTTAITRVFASNDSFLRYYTLANFAKQLQSALSKTINFVYGGDPSVSIGAVTVNRLWTNPLMTSATVTKVQCWTDAGTVNLQLVRSDGTGMHTAISCTTAGVSTATFTTATVSTNQGIGFITSTVSGVKNLSVEITYTPTF